ncbi:hypothetical protein OAU75_00795 [Flavobacteriaceae bacterium]|nr:hypothetical protein [Flavobacteriaceae bacterium]
MIEKIKIALKAWAEKVLENQSQWDTDEIHQAIHKLYELSVCQKILNEDGSKGSDLWKRQQAELSSVIETLTGSTKGNKIEKEEEFEVPPMMETIKNMVTEMPEPENFERLFEVVKDSPVFVPKNTKETKKDFEKSTILSETENRKNLNDHFSKTLSIDLNDRLAFVKHLFKENVSAYEAVISQLVTFSSWGEVQNFISLKVKTEYPHWTEKEAIEKRFMSVLKNNFST